MRSALAFLVLIGLSMGPSGTPPPSAPPAGDCEEGRVPMVWPLGLDGFEPKMLYDSHGQFQMLPPASTETTHAGLDIAACVGEPVYACVAGQVVYKQYTEGDDHNLLIIADADDPTQGFIYEHLDEVWVGEGESVLRDQALGTIVTFVDYAGFDHLHLQRMVNTTPLDPWLAGMADNGSPLPLLAARADGARPKILPVGPPTPAGVPFRFYVDGTDTTALPKDLLTLSVDVVAKVSELFPGLGPPTCATTLCGGLTIANQVTPARLTLSVFRPVVEPAPTTLPHTVVDEVYTNRIDLEAPNIIGTDLAKHLYRSESVGTYTERDFLIILTNCPADGLGAWKVSDPGEYIVQLVIEDSSGNVGVRSMTINVDP